MYKPWHVEIRRLIGILVGGLVLGLLIGLPTLGLLVALFGYVAWQLYQMRRFYNWVVAGKRSEPLQTSGVWEYLVHEQQRLYQRSRRRKKKIAKLIQRFHESSAAMPDAAVILGHHLEIEWFNNAAIELLGLKLPQDIGRRITNLLRHPDFLEYIDCGKYHEPVEFPSGNESQRILHARLVPYGNKQFLLSVRDVTRLYRLEKMRRDFVANVSHELRTPLTVISGYLESLLDDEELAPELRHSLDVMQAQSHRMQRLLEDLLTLSRLETHENTQAPQHEVDVPKLLHEITATAYRLADERAQTLDIDIDEEVLLKGAASELHSAFANLLNNAIRYTPEGGQITLRWYASVNGVHFVVKDTGIGIAAHHIPRLTERFYRIDSDRSRESGGTGLGLAIVKHVLGRHDASLHIESTLGQGSLFACNFSHKRLSKRDSEAISLTADIEI